MKKDNAYLAIILIMAIVIGVSWRNNYQQLAMDRMIKDNIIKQTDFHINFVLSYLDTIISNNAEGTKVNLSPSGNNEWQQIVRSSQLLSFYLDFLQGRIDGNINLDKLRSDAYAASFEILEINSMLINDNTVSYEVLSKLRSVREKYRSLKLNVSKTLESVPDLSETQE